MILHVYSKHLISSYKTEDLIDCSVAHLNKRSSCNISTFYNIDLFILKLVLRLKVEFMKSCVRMNCFKSALGSSYNV